MKGEGDIEGGNDLKESGIKREWRGRKQKKGNRNMESFRKREIKEREREYHKKSDGLTSYWEWVDRKTEINVTNDSEEVTKEKERGERVWVSEKERV